MNSQVTLVAENVIDLLKTDHQDIKDAFEHFNSLKDNDFTSKDKLIHQLCQDLLLHLIAEENVLYPVLSDAIPNGPDLILESVSEHEDAKAQIAKLQRMHADDPLYTGSVKMLAEHVHYHFEEEENYIFPLLEQSGANLVLLAQHIEQAKEMAR